MNENEVVCNDEVEVTEANETSNNSKKKALVAVGVVVGVGAGIGFLAHKFKDKIKAKKLAKRIKDVEKAGYTVMDLSPSKDEESSEEN